MQVDWWTLGLQTINFLVVIWLLSRFLYRPIRTTIEEREAADRAASDAAQKKAAEAEEARKAYERKRADLAEEQRKREAEWHEKLQQERAETLEAARKEAAQILEAAHKNLEREETQAMDALKDRVLALATDLARTAIHGTVTRVTEVIARLDALSEDDARELRKDLAGETTSLAVVTASETPENDRVDWREALSRWLGHEASVTFQTDSAILAGVELHFPHAALRYSAAAGLERAAEILKE